MARKKIKLSVKTASPAKPASEEDWMLRDDADKIRRYAELKSDSGRYSKALGHLSNEHRTMSDILARETASNYRADEGISKPKIVARSGRKKSSRLSRRGVSR